MKLRCHLNWLLYSDCNTSYFCITLEHLDGVISFSENAYFQRNVVSEEIFKSRD